MTERIERRSGSTSRDGRASSPNGRGAARPDRVEALRDEIAHTRADLGKTVQALAAKVDVKARMRDGVTDMSSRGRELATRFGDAVRQRPAPIAVAIGAAVLILALVRWRRNR